MYVRLYEFILILTQSYLQSEICWTNDKSCFLYKQAIGS